MGMFEALTYADGSANLVTLWWLVSALEADAAVHATARAKGDGTLTIATVDGTRQLFVVRAACGELDALLARFG